MSASQQQRRVAVGLVVLATAVIAACDARATAPAPVSAIRVPPASIEGDTTRCLRGWTVVGGVYVCNEDL